MAKGRGLPAEERRAMIVDAVLELSSERDPAEITTAAIAERVGVTQGALFRHFPNKESVWSAALERVAGMMLSAVEGSVKRTASPLEGLEAAFFATVRFATSHPGAPRLLLSELRRGGEGEASLVARSMMLRYTGLLRELIDEGLERGEIRSDVQPDAVAHFLVGAVQGLAIQSLIGGDVGMAVRNAPGAFEIFRRGVEVRS
ncbi:MAG: TetR/AcrR family transcriptional regulator [Synergistaceae bacterium]|nr:TetR/AcrR family transcriptional regulator [Synergistaceae bacterium]